MYKHIAEYVLSIERLAGKRWIRSEPALQLLTTADLKVVAEVRSGRAKTDLDVVKLLFGANARISLRYRRRIGILTRRLALVLLGCPLSRSVDKRKQQSIDCLRHLAIGESLLRSRAPKSARDELHEALSNMVYPELSWYAPPVYLSLAYYHAVNGRGSLARRDLELAITATYEASMTSTLLDHWVRLSIPVRRKSEKERQNLVITSARQTLTRLARKPMSGIIAMAAARLATTLSQLLHNKSLGLRWLEHSRIALEREQRFDKAAAREYHLQRLLMYNMAHDYLAGVAEVRQVVSISPVGSVDWFTAMNSLLHLQLLTAQYTDAFKTANELLVHPNRARISSELSGRIKLRAQYAWLLAHEVTAQINAPYPTDRYPLDRAVLRILFAIRRDQVTEANDAMHSLSRLILRTKNIRRIRDYWLLSRLLTIYADNGHDLKACQKLAVFLRFDHELNDCGWIHEGHTVISPRLIWKAIRI